MLYLPHPNHTPGKTCRTEVYLRVPARRTGMFWQHARGKQSENCWITLYMIHNVDSLLWWFFFLLSSSQTCLLNMTDYAFPIIFCMESSSDVIKSAKNVRNSLSTSLHPLFCLCHFPYHKPKLLCVFPFIFVCSARKSTPLNWNGKPWWSVWTGTRGCSWCIRMPWQPKGWNLHTNMCPGWPLMG